MEFLATERNKGEKYPRTTKFKNLFSDELHINYILLTFHFINPLFLNKFRITLLLSGVEIRKN